MFRTWGEFNRCTKDQQLFGTNGADAQRTLLAAYNDWLLPGLGLNVEGLVNYPLHLMR